MNHPLSRSTLLLLLLLAETTGRCISEEGAWDARFFLDGINGEVHAVAAHGEELYVGGSFTSADGVLAANVARWTGTNWAALGAGLNGAVHAIAVSGPVVYVGGTFTHADGLPVNRIAKWDGTEWTALGSGVKSSDFAEPMLASTTSPENFARGRAVPCRRASSANTRNPTLCLVPAYFRPGLPNPTINFMPTTLSGYGGAAPRSDDVVSSLPLRRPLCGQ